ncbi:dihydrolipoamide dehydrogenase [Rhizobium sp. Root1203]|uniref:dihydrolipoyl dehydrogenase n=1 Tax=Rhizobium sp. Root1203 TaxID=1736427 RepID=UPI00070F5E58|nr:dihydrolipoyl dehydrogenase [Rhizobium sp. Root1203]KQV19501.1 dihydrolipoamide dehydrogenase [Rhizobium sp. Root1203]
MKEIVCKLLVIGAGPAGYVCAIRAGQLGIDTVIVEDKKPGGTCLNVGCIPSKALIHAAEEFDALRLMGAGKHPAGIRVEGAAIDLARTMAWKDGIVGRLTSGVTALLHKAKVKIVHGRAVFLDGKMVEVATETGAQIIRAENVVIATGSQPVELPALPFGGAIISSTEALALKELPKKLVVVGGGYIGLELGTAFSKLGSEVSIIEATAQILPQYDADLVRPVQRKLAERNIRVQTMTKALSSDDHGLRVETADGKQEHLAADRILVTVGREPNTSGSGLEQLDLDRSGRFIRIDDRCRTSMRSIYAIGDVTGEPMLAHRAMAQGEMVAEILAGRKRAWDKRCIPAVCFTDPEIVTAGLSPDEARAQGYDIRVGQFPFSANGRAMTMQSEEGFVRIVARADTNLVLGLQAVGQGVSELSADFALAIEMGSRLEDIAGTIHAHPTRSEAIQEAALKALGHALHI